MSETLIQRALTQGWFTLHYQPKIDLRTKRVKSAEALIRMQTPEGMVLPGSFIPQAEKSGEIVALDRWVFARLIEDARYIAMLSQAEIDISFNVSATHFHAPDFLENLENIFHYTSDFLSRFTLEITEYSLFAKPDEALQSLERLKQKGFSIALDDFGTGYSSLIYLKDFPIDTLKIDKAFLDGMLEDPKYLKILDAILYLARKLDLGTVAEGVETIEQVQWLFDNGCDEIQGYYYARPMPIDEFVLFVKALNPPESANRFIRWNAAYTVGDPALDSHHMIIAGILNRLYDELKNADLIEKTAVGDYFHLLERYVRIHFEAEEAYMRRCRYEGMAAHMAEHEAFVRRLARIRQDLGANNVADSLALFKMLRSWFVDHELKKDRVFLEALRPKEGD